MTRGQWDWGRVCYSAADFPLFAAALAKEPCLYGRIAEAAILLVKPHLPRLPIDVRSRPSRCGVILERDTLLQHSLSLFAAFEPYRPWPGAILSRSAGLPPRYLSGRPPAPRLRGTPGVSSAPCPLPQRQHDLVPPSAVSRKTGDGRPMPNNCLSPRKCRPRLVPRSSYLILTALRHLAVASHRS